MRVVFLGTGDIGVPSLKALATTGFHEVQAVFTQPDRPAGRDLKLRPPPVKGAARELDLPVFQPEKIRAPDALAELVTLKPDVIVVAAYGQILPKAILSLPRFGCINIHASLLPRHRGASPIQAAILEGDSETGVTIMQMDEGLDTGDILFKVATPSDRARQPEVCTTASLSLHRMPCWRALTFWDAAPCHEKSKTTRLRPTRQSLRAKTAKLLGTSRRRKLKGEFAP